MDPDEQLQALEEEIVRMTKLYSDAESIFRLVERRQGLFDQITHMEVCVQRRGGYFCSW